MQSGVAIRLCARAIQQPQRRLTAPARRATLKSTCAFYQPPQQIRFYGLPKNKYTDSLKREPLAPLKRVDTLRDDIAEKLRKSRTIEGRRELGMFVIEDLESIKAALEAGVKLTHIAVRDDVWDSGELDLVLHEPGTICIISERIMKHIFSSGRLPEIVALCKDLHPNFKELSKFAAMNKLLILDDIINPRNIGGLLHVAEAFGVQGVLVLTSQSTDKGTPMDLLLSRHSLRASLGALFRIPTLLCSKSDLVAFLAENKIQSIALDHTSPIHIDMVTQSLLAQNPIVVSEGPEPPAKKKKKSAMAVAIKKGKKKVALKAKKKKSSASASRKTLNFAEILTGKFALVVGNESTGVSQDLLEASTVRVSVPTTGVPVLNVNVATGILLHSFFGPLGSAASQAEPLPDEEGQEG